MIRRRILTMILSVAILVHGAFAFGNILPSHPAERFFNDWYIAFEKVGENVKINISVKSGDTYIASEELTLPLSEQDKINQFWSKILDKIFKPGNNFPKLLINYSSGMRDGQINALINRMKGINQNPKIEAVELSMQSRGDSPLKSAIFKYIDQTPKLYWSDFNKGNSREELNADGLKAKASFDKLESQARKMPAVRRETEAGYREYQNRQREEDSRRGSSFGSAVASGSGRKEIDQRMEVKKLCDRVTSHLDDLIQEDLAKDKSKVSDQHFLDYLVPHPEIELSPDAQRVKWDHVKGTVLPPLPKPNPSYFNEYGSLDKEVLSGDYKKIFEGLQKVSAQHGIQVDSDLVSDYENFYKLIKGGALSETFDKDHQIQESLALLADYYVKALLEPKTPLETEDILEALSYLTDIFREFRHCEDAKGTTVEMYVRAVIQKIQITEKKTAKAIIDDLIADAKEQKAQDIFPFHQLASARIIQEIQKKKKVGGKLTPEEEYLYYEYIIRKVEKAYRDDPLLRDTPLESVVSFHDCDSNLIVVARETYESAGGFANIRNHVDPEIGFAKLPSLKYGSLASGNHSVWKVKKKISDYREEDDFNHVPTVLFKNHFGAAHLSKLVQDHLLTASRKQEFEDLQKSASGKKGAQKAEKHSKQYPLDYGLIESNFGGSKLAEMYEMKSWSPLLEPVQYPQDKPVMWLEPGDKVEEALLELIETDLKRKVKVGGTEYIGDFTPNAGEKMLQFLGYIGPGKESKSEDGPPASGLDSLVIRGSGLRGNTPLVRIVEHLPEEVFITGSEGRASLDLRDLRDLRGSRDPSDLVSGSTLHYVWKPRGKEYGLRALAGRYAILDPARNFSGELFGTKHDDTIAIGGHAYSKEAILIVPESEAKEITAKLKGFPGKVVSYPAEQSIGQAIDKALVGFQALEKESGVSSSETVGNAPLDYKGSLFDRIVQMRGIRNLALTHAGLTCHTPTQITKSRAILDEKIQELLKLREEVMRSKSHPTLTKRVEYLQSVEESMRDLITLLEVRKYYLDPIPEEKVAHVLAYARTYAEDEGIKNFGLTRSDESEEQMRRFVSKAIWRKVLPPLLGSSDPKFASSVGGVCRIEDAPSSGSIKDLAQAVESMTDADSPLSRRCEYTDGMTYIALVMEAARATIHDPGVLEFFLRMVERFARSGSEKEKLNAQDYLNFYRLAQDHVKGYAAHRFHNLRDSSPPEYESDELMKVDLDFAMAQILKNAREAKQNSYKHEDDE